MGTALGAALVLVWGGDSLDYPVDSKPISSLPQLRVFIPKSQPAYLVHIDFSPAFLGLLCTSLRSGWQREGLCSWPHSSSRGKGIRGWVLGALFCFVFVFAMVLSSNQSRLWFSESAFLPLVTSWASESLFSPSSATREGS